MIKKIILGLALIIITTQAGMAQSNDVSVGIIDLSKIHWGTQTTNIELTNNTEYLKYLVTEIDFSFTDSYLNSNRTVRSVHILYPEQSKEVAAEFYVPGNYGKAEVVFRLYDVIDTLDVLMDYQKVFEQPFHINFRIPEAVMDYVQEKITLPPRVNDHPYYSNEFVRVFLLMVSEGKPISEIASVANCDTAFIHETAKFMVDQKFIKRTDTGYELNFPLITLAEAEATRKLVDKFSDELVANISINIKNYWTVFDSLADAKDFPRDSNDFISGATLFYQPYPIVSALLLWHEFGQKFITRSAPLVIYDGTDLCNADIYQYMYAVVGGDYFNGTHYYNYQIRGEDVDINFSRFPVEVSCASEYKNNDFKLKPTQRSRAHEFPEYYIIDSSKIRPLINLLGKNCEPLLDQAYNELKDIALANNHSKVSFGHRYWFWNLVATNTLDKLIDQNVITPRGNSKFRFDNIVKRKANEQSKHKH